MNGEFHDNSNDKNEDFTLNRKKDKKGKVKNFFEKQGFYLMAVLCVAIIGAAVFIALGSPPDEGNTNDQSVQQIEHGGIEQHIASNSAKPSQSVAPTPTPRVSEKPSATPKPSDTATARIELIEPVAGEVIKGFSMDQLVFSNTLEQWMTHGGIDIAAAQGTDVLAAGAGTVAEVKTDGLLGKMVILAHDHNIRTVYANLADTEMVKVGDYLEQGDVLGKVGNTALGESKDESHLHFEVLAEGKRVNPEDYFETIIQTQSTK
ncbi:MAG: peptidoglycan DD-metalloendopeptidase family protein [Christensenellales bacterium]|jgi:murein DD-endopeptidase MepM/ murein hydrolase activator NlpD